nr:glycosyltransferase family 4 protein [Allopontixanthobacter sediminis]
MTYPSGYEDLESALSRRFTAAARVAAVFVNRIIPGKRKAAVLLVANARTRAALPVIDHPRLVTLVENGVDLSIWRTEVRHQVRLSNDPFRLAFVGRLIALKAVDLTLHALLLARSNGIDARLSIVGEGEEMETLKALVGALSLNDAVDFHGFLSQPECAKVLSNADALILNSVHECGGAVVLEAMGLGLPVIASNWGGPADYVDSSCGILVSPIPRADFAANLAKAIGKLASDPTLARNMGRSGRQKVEEHFDWEKKIDRMLLIYQDALLQAAGVSA